MTHPDFFLKRFVPFMGCLAVLTLNGCVIQSRPISFEAVERAPVILEEHGHVAIARFSSSEGELDTGKEFTDLLRRALEIREPSLNVSILTEQDWKARIPEQPAEWFANKDAPFWHLFLDSTAADLLIFGSIDFQSRTYLGPVTETIEDPVTGQPMRRTVRRELTTYQYRLRLGLVDLIHAELAYQQELEKTADVQGPKSLDDFFTILEPHAQDFLDAITGKRRVEHRFLLR